jgi:hypothetical protein
MINWLVASDFQHIRDLWLNKVLSINKTLVDCLFLINPLDTQDHKNQASQASIECSLVSLRIKPVIQVAKSVIPVIKLARMFFKKLLERAMNSNQQLPFSTEMDSDQLNFLSGTATHVCSSFNQILETLKINKQGNYNGGMVILQATKIQHDLQESLFYVLLYFVPQIPETQAGFPGQADYRKWFIFWFTDLNLAIQNLIDVAKLLPDPEDNVSFPGNLLLPADP